MPQWGKQCSTLVRRSGSAGTIGLAGVLLAACSTAELPSDGKPVQTCCGGRGSCLPSAFLEKRYVGLLGPQGCVEDTMCVPDELRAVDVPRSCHAGINGAEGRCLPACLPSVAARGDQLAQDGCDPFQRCVPCYDPLTGASTSACSLGNDTGAAEPPSTFAACCGDLGRCVPQAAVPEAQRAQLGPDTCAKAATLCAPLASLEKGKDYVPASCTTLGFGTEGRCLPGCLPALAEQRDRLGQTSCQSGEVCAPCNDPVSGESTGSCALGADLGPKQSNVELETCCDGLGHCMPEKVLSSTEAARLSSESCTRADSLCAPDVLADKHGKPDTCTVSALGAEGRCLPSCLPEVAKQADRLKQEACPDHHLCSPCADPVTGKSTGACENGADPGPAAPPVVFDSCCDGFARCVPAGAVDEAQRSLLGHKGCEGTDLCVPTELASNPSLVSSSCTVSSIQSEGRCLSECLPQIDGQRARLSQDGCGKHQLCAPCVDPISGVDTGACSLGGDPGPSRATRVFASCCEGTSRCVPETSVAAPQASQLSRETCADKELCVPTTLASDPSFVPKTCTVSSLKTEGRCLSECLPTVAGQRDRLQQDGCGAHELCAPCIDPFSGSATGACSLGADRGPRGTSVVFPSCCDGRARCVPDASVPAEQRAQLGHDSCGTNDWCVPTELVGGKVAAPDRCVVSALQTEGRCLSTCLPAVAARQGVFRQDGCHLDQACVPCFDPVTGKDTGACSSTGDSGPAAPAKTLAACCGGQGRCAPKAWVPTDQASNFGADSCQDVTTQLCVAPAAALSEPTFVPVTCEDERSHAEGRCLPACLPPVAARATALTRGPCPADQLCTPCFDPLSGTSTGACDTGADPGPSKPPVTFEACCGSTPRNSSGVCIPTELVPAGAPELPRQSCADPGAVCAPRALASDPHARFPTCRSLLVSRGVCIESCYLSPLVQAVAPSGDCAASQNCVSCSLLGSSIGGCQTDG